MQKERPSYFSVTPANVRYAEDLTLLQKFLWGEISALSNKEGFCWASNSYFANLYGKNEKYISGVINDMAKKGYIAIEVNQDEGNKRKISIANLNTYSEKPEDPYSEKPEHNNTSINNNNLGVQEDSISKRTTAYLNAFNKLFDTGYRMTNTKKNKLATRLKSFTYKEIIQSLKAMAKDEFFRGRNDRGWRASPEWHLHNDEHIERFLERSNNPQNLEHMKEQSVFGEEEFSKYFDYLEDKGGKNDNK